MESIMSKNGKEEIQESKITITFLSPGSALFDVVSTEDIYPSQLLALSQWFEFEGKNMLAQQRIIQAQQAEQNRIAQPDKLFIPKQ